MLFMVGVIALAVWFGAPGSMLSPVVLALLIVVSVAMIISYGLQREALGLLVRPDRAQRPGFHVAGAAGDPGRRRRRDHPDGHGQQGRAAADHRRQMRCRRRGRPPGWPEKASVGAEHALQPAGTGGSRPVHPRRLLHLPQPDDPPFRHEVLRYGELLAAGGVAAGPPVPVGQQAHGAGPGARGRQVRQPVALPAPDEPAADVAGVDHAVVPAFSRPGR